MKKSQILAALALAFALGVVAPVASVMNSTSVSAYNAQASTATFPDTTRALAFVEENSTYKAYVQIQEARTAYSSGLANGSIADLSGTEGTDIATAVQAATGRGFNYNATKLASDLAAEANFAQKINIAKATAENSEYYKKIAAVISLLDNGSDSGSDDALLHTALNNLRTYTIQNGILNDTAWDDFHPNAATISGYRASNPLLAGNLLGTSYTQAEDIYDAIKDGKEALKKFNAGYDLFVPLLNNSGLLTQATKNTIAANANVTVANLDTYASDSNLIRGSQWRTLYDEVQTVKENRVSEESGDNYRLIRNLAIAWQGATGNEQSVNTVIERMVNFVSNSGESDKDTNDKDNSGNKAPDTGILADAEGNASTTVAMVAGVATALTAAGAGVVAYRNARRSTRK